MPPAPADRKGRLWHIAHDVAEAATVLVADREVGERGGAPKMDIGRIMDVLPHRYPFLLVDRIIEVSVLKLLPGGAHDHRTRRVNPGVPIPMEATTIHGISDDDVADMPTFRAIAPGLARYLDGCDLCGYNILKYDLRLLAA